MQSDLLLHLQGRKRRARGHARLLVGATLPGIPTARWLTARLQCRSSILRRGMQRYTLFILPPGRRKLQACGRPLLSSGGLTSLVLKTSSSALSATWVTAFIFLPECGPSFTSHTLALHQLHLSHAGTAPDAGRRHWSGSLQADTPRSFELDAVFECLAFADRMSLHAVAAKCEWALTQLWRDKSVHTRAVLELSPEAVHRVARSLSAMIREDERRAGHFDSNYMGARWQAPESAETMMQWRMS